MRFLNEMTFEVVIFYAKVCQPIEFSVKIDRRV